jgi:hypothetical protein
MVQRGFQDSQDAIRGGASLADTISALVGFAVVRPATRLTAREGRFLSEALMPVLQPFLG